MTAEKAAQLLAHFRQTKQPVFHVQHENLNPDLPFMKPGSEGQALHPLVKPAAGEALIVKNYPNAFWQTTLFEQLKEANVGDVVICGMMSQLCVQTTSTSAMEHGFSVTVIEDACATQPTEVLGQPLSAHSVHCSAMAAMQVFAQITNSNAWLKVADDHSKLTA